MKEEPHTVGKQKYIRLSRLKRVRQIKGYSLQELADKSGVDVSLISKLENERHGAQGRTLRKLAKALGVEPEELVG
jgi:HTH-type transcriptional regulator, competence development regulator